MAAFGLRCDGYGDAGDRQVGRVTAARGLGTKLGAAFGLVLAIAALGAAFGASAASAGVLTVTLDGTGKGAVTSVPAGIECSNVPGAEKAECSHDFGPIFETGKLTATPGPGFAFLAWSGTGGGTCIDGTNPCTTTTLLLDHAVTATFAPAPEPPTVTTGTATDIDFPSAKVAGTVNPGNDEFAVSDCYFEYGPTTEYGEKVPCNPKSVGTGTSPVAVSASIGVLDPGRTYHYRLVAANGGGTRFGDDVTLVGGAAPADDCPNAAIRAEQGALAQRLPNCGAYELVSPLFTAGQGATAYAGTADGNVAPFNSVGGFEGVENLPDLGTFYRAERTESGWKTSAIAPPAKEFPYLLTAGALDFTRDVSRSLWFVNLKVDEGTARFTPIVRDPDGSFHIAGVTQTDLSAPAATAAGLSMVIQRTKTRPALTDGTVDSRSASVNSLYASTYGADGQLSVRQVAYRDGATMFPTCGVEVGGTNTIGGSQYARNSVSRDGGKIFFTPTGQGTCAAAAARRVWAKIGDADPIDLSESQCPETCGTAAAVYFRGASLDGSRVYFTTQQQLLPEDQDTTNKNDLYEYDFNATGQKLRLVTGSAEPAGAGVNAIGPFRVSPDGSYVYFTATGRALAGPNSRGASPQPGADNLYVYHRAAGEADGTTTFVGTVGSAYTGYALSPQISATGRFLLFDSTANLTGERVSGDTQSDIYRYDADEDVLLRVWTDDPAHNGAARIAGATVESGVDASGGAPSGGSERGGSGEWFLDLQVSEDGSLVGFTTAEPLSPDDHNTRSDGYLWEAETGRITMLTDGSSGPANQFSGSGFKGMTPSGDSLFITQASPLLKEHTSGQNAAYVIRRNGGFPGQAPPPVPCAGDPCQGPIAAPPAAAAAGSADFSGPGNPSPASVSVAKPKAVVGRTAKLRVRVPEAGRITVTGAALRQARGSARRAQTVTVRVTLRPKAKRQLEKTGKLRVRARVAFEPRAGGSDLKTVTVVFKQPKQSKRGDR